MKKINLKNVVVLFVMLTFINGYGYNNALRIRITGNGFSDETVVRLLPDATEDFDGAYDAWKLFSSNINVPSIYTEIEEGMELSINSLPEYNKDQSILIYTNTPITGYYTITVEEVFPFSTTYQASLTDVSNSVNYPVLGGNEFTIYMEQGEHIEALSLNISTPFELITQNETCFGNNDGNIEITNTGNTDWSYLILDKDSFIVANNTSNTETITYSNLISGNYYVIVESKGIIDESSFTINEGIELIAQFELLEDTLYLNEGASLEVINNSVNVVDYYWNFGDGNTSYAMIPTHEYFTSGAYSVLLNTSNGICSKTTSKTLVVRDHPDLTTSMEKLNQSPVKLLTLANAQYQITTKEAGEKTLLVHSMEGKIILQNNFISNRHNFVLNNFNKGMYVVSVVDKNGLVFQSKLLN